MRAAVLAVVLTLLGCGGSADAGPAQMLIVGTENAVNGSAQITWVAPTLDVASASGQGGSSVSDIGGYKVYKSAVSGLGPWTLVTDISGTGTLTYTATGLGFATWYFCVATYDTAGHEGVCSYAGSKTLP